MKEITAYKLSDGSIVEGHTEAKVKESSIEFNKQINIFAGLYGSYSDGKSALYNAIVDNKRDLKVIFEKHGMHI